MSVAFPGYDGGGSSVLDSLGEEITGIAWPVSICMAVTVFLVRVLNPTGASSSSTVFIASAAYNENANVRPCMRNIRNVFGFGTNSGN